MKIFELMRVIYHLPTGPPIEFAVAIGHQPMVARCEAVLVSRPPRGLAVVWG